jgi:hypothetical protein
LCKSLVGIQLLWCACFLPCALARIVGARGGTVYVVVVVVVVCVLGRGGGYQNELTEKALLFIINNLTI